MFQEIKTLDLSRRSLRSFGFVVGGILLIITGFSIWRHGWPPSLVGTILGASGVVLIGAGGTYPAMLRPFYIAWMSIALVAGFVMTRILLTLVFFIMITPIGLIMRLFGHDSLSRKSSAKESSYWINKVYTDDTHQRLEHYY